MSQFEYRCPIHRRIRDVDMDRPVPQGLVCPIREDDVACGLPLFVAEVGNYSSQRARGSEREEAPAVGRGWRPPRGGSLGQLPAWGDRGRGDLLAFDWRRFPHAVLRRQLGVAVLRQRGVRPTLESLSGEQAPIEQLVGATRESRPRSHATAAVSWPREAFGSRRS
jgi:hypothetical protein